ncbi:unnamed protein product [Mytilus edulis]|uniref:Uncharacterized protein n=1 Tax=Mytilus edulis TaxID=6550 RepID=A0A8S3TT52_MYTED|nr:unnamed protein product [Mytilus edulis]
MPMYEKGTLNVDRYFGRCTGWTEQTMKCLYNDANMILLLILIIETATAYDFKCPAQKIETKSKRFLFGRRQICLFVSFARPEIQGKLFRSKRSSIGSNLVFQPRFNIADCNAGRFQPITFTTDGHSECILLKSKCDEEGQVVHSNGTSGHNIACRCDYTKGYAFVSKPGNSCFCKPDVEDCSCFRVKCANLSAGQFLKSIISISKER